MSSASSSALFPVFLLVVLLLLFLLLLLLPSPPVMLLLHLLVVIRLPLLLLGSLRCFQRSQISRSTIIFFEMLFIGFHRETNKIKGFSSCLS